MPEPGRITLRCRAEMIVLDSTPTIRLSLGPFLLGYFATLPALLDTLARHFVDLADVEIVKSKVPSKLAS